MTMGQVMGRWALAMAVAVAFSSLSPAAQAQSEATILIFFDWGKPEIGKDAADQLDAIANSYRAAPAMLRVTGHSDRSGGAAGNRRAALQRAETVAGYLAKRGVPPSAISTASFGEEQPLIRTADGVREPQNRRVEIHVVSALKS